MSATLLDISKKIDPHKAAILTAVDRAASRLDIPVFVVGAAARDFILQNGHDIPTPRATLDIDFGVCVSSWDQFMRLIETLMTEDHFKRTTIEHRLESPAPKKILVDIVPFGAIEGADRTIVWQQENREMNIAGFTEAYRYAIDVKISSTPLIMVKMVSLAGLALLKLFSWNGKPFERDRDAKDFRLIMYKYLEAQPAEYVFDVHPDIVSDGDYDLISARTLGRDMNTIAGHLLSPALLEILNRECDRDGDLRFIQQMQQTFFDREMTAGRDMTMLNALRQGVRD